MADSKIIEALHHVARTAEEHAKIDAFRERWQKNGDDVALKEFMRAEPSIFLRLYDLAGKSGGVQDALTRELREQGIRLMELERKFRQN